MIALFPGVAAFYWSFTKSPERGFIDVYLPVLFMLPDYYRCILPGLPDPTFSHTAVAGVFAAFVMRGFPGYRFTFTDGLVYAFAAAIFYSEYRAAGYAEAQNLLVDMLGYVVLPYVLTKSLVEPNGMRVAFAKRVVWLLFALSCISVYEFKFGTTPFRLLFDPFFPGQGRGWVTTFRWGFARVAGPYGHAILCGTIFIVGFRIARWLQWSGAWEPHFKKFPKLPLSKGAIMTLGILAGAVMSLVRGPWIGGFLGAAIVFVGKMKNRGAVVAALLAFIVFVGIPMIIKFHAYVSVGRENALTPGQESAAYRYELIVEYGDIAMEEATWGWGRNTWPKVLGMPSIDNYYLLLFLMHGAIAVMLLLTIMFSMMGRLIVHGMMLPPPERAGSSLAFTLAGIYVGIIFSIATVFLGLQVMPLLFIITGWAEGYLNSGTEGLGDETAPKAQPSISARPYNFRRVVL